ncbi:hypothetical protein DPMN_184510 [Dreissena polymorpha]|uniref:Uncharacterized protein n=1 Tax=Dreissena polymorpha TaxID=45954 RepID=A0A9D4I6I2_DREPO|nr:hypothetical protein DPMN_184510 [Dreissena polymorpha]
MFSDQTNRKPTILIAKEWDVRQLNMDGTVYGSEGAYWLKPAQKAETLDFDYRDKKICWVYLNIFSTVIIITIKFAGYI